MRDTTAAANGIRRLLAGIALAGLCGCASVDTFREADAASRPGGSLDRQKAAERDAQAAERARQRQLQAAQTEAAVEVQRMDTRIAAAQEQNRQQDAALADALRLRRISREQHDALKREHDAVRSELAELDLQHKNDQFKRRDDAQAQQRKEAKLKALQQRERDLKDRLAAVMKM